MEPTTVVRGADLDLVELALTVGGLEVRSPGGSSRLVDPEGTPVAEAIGSELRALHPLAPRPEIAAIRVDPLDVVAEASAAVVFDALPTRAQVAAVDAIAADGPIAWIALVGRARRGVGAAALLGAVGAAAGRWSSRSGRGSRLGSLPWSLDAAPEVLSSAPLASPEAFVAWLPSALGVPEVVLFGEGAEHRALAALETDAAGAARALFPPEVLPFHRGTHPTGAMILFTGLSGSGKSTVARGAAARLSAEGETVTLLDGDDVRRLLSADLGFDADGRALNVRRIGWMGAQLARAGAVAIAAPIAPFAAGRAEARAFARAAGARFVLVHVATPLEVCERRDRKGHYAEARAGRLADFTGISSPYEPPTDADVVLDTTTGPLDAHVDAVLDALERAAG